MRRAMLTFLLMFGSASVGAGAAAGQATARLGADLRAALRPVLEQAGRDSVPTDVLEAKALEGQAKRRPAAQIVAVVGQLATELRDARGLLREAAPSAVLPVGEIVAAAEAIRRNVPTEDVRALRARARGPASLEIPFAVLGALVERGVPAGDARAVIGEMLDAEVPQARMIEIPARIDVALRVGAAPVAALNSALQGLGIPVPAIPMGRPGRPGAIDLRGSDGT